MMNRASMALILEGYFCPNSTDAQGKAANHYIREGACVICDRTTLSLAYLHGVA